MEKKGGRDLRQCVEIVFETTKPLWTRFEPIISEIRSNNASVVGIMLRPHLPQAESQVSTACEAG
jgi:hypothetical protein